MGKRLTVILTLKDRPSYTSFFLSHSIYSQYEYLVLDGGFGPDNEQILTQSPPTNLTYVRYAPDETYDHYLAKVRDGLQRVTTPYLIRIDNDDVLLEPGTERALSALDEDQDSISAGGDLTGFFHDGPGSSRSSLPFALTATKDLDCPDAVRALSRNRLSYRPLWNSVMRTEPYRDTWEAVANVRGIEPHLTEFAVADTLLARGRFIHQTLPHYLRLENQRIRGIASLVRPDQVEIGSPTWWNHSDRIDAVISKLPMVAGSHFGTQRERVRLLQEGVKGSSRRARYRIRSHQRLGAIRLVPFAMTKTLASRGLVLPLPLYTAPNT